MLIFFLLIIFCSCAVQEQPLCLKNGRKYGRVEGNFRGKWWDYYERGLSYAEGKCFEEALADFREAVKLRIKDQRKAQTYGTIFIDYFPHRESGIVHYQKGDLRASEKELETSLSHFPTAKARYYLDRVRRTLIDEEQQVINPPKISLDFAKKEIWTNESPVVISGDAEDEHYIMAITIKGTPLFFQGAQKHIHFREALALSQGRHNIDIEAKNLAGKITKKRIIINVDRKGPSIIIKELHPEQSAEGKEAVIAGFIDDEAGVAALFINEEEIPIRQSKEVNFERRIKLSSDIINIVTYDSLKNRTYTKLSLSDSLTNYAPILIASANAMAVCNLGKTTAASPLIIFYRGGLEDNQTVFQDKLFIEFELTSNWNLNIKNVKINGEDVRCRVGPKIIDSHEVKLKEGKNKITLEVKDEEGNYERKEINVTRKIPPALRLENRLSILISPIKHYHGGRVVDDGYISHKLCDLMKRAIFRRERFRILNKDAQVKLEGTFDETSAATEFVVEITGEESEILGYVEFYKEAKDMQTLKGLAEQISQGLLWEFPLLRGKVCKIKDNYLFTDLIHDKLKKKEKTVKLIIYREENLKYADGEDTKTVIYHDIIGYARIMEILADMTHARFLDCGPEVVNIHDKVITQ